jgi:hypothetical protein
MVTVSKAGAGETAGGFRFWHHEDWLAAFWPRF